MTDPAIRQPTATAVPQVYTTLHLRAHELGYQPSVEQHRDGSATCHLRDTRTGTAQAFAGNTFDEACQTAVLWMSTPEGQRQATTPDAPPCPDCGGLMQRTGACYTCTGCGSTTGCG